MNKKNLLLAIAFLLVFLAGIATIRVWDSFHSDMGSQNNEVGSDSLLIVDMEEALEPEGVVDINEPKYVDDDTLPSQLSKIKVQGLERIISRSGASYEAPEEEPEDSAVVLGNVDRNAVPSATAPAAVSPDSESKISMIEAPVKVLLIKTLDEYKNFKRMARGKYPTADFSKDYVVVLESNSNLPDKVFEIQDVQEENGKMVIIYRVNIFGLDQKTNTHSAVRIEKRDLPIELKQVL